MPRQNQNKFPRKGKRNRNKSSQPKLGTLELSTYTDEEEEYPKDRDNKLQEYKESVQENVHEWKEDNVNVWREDNVDEGLQDIWYGGLQENVDEEIDINKDERMQGNWSEENIDYRRQENSYEGPQKNWDDVMQENYDEEAQENVNYEMQENPETSSSSLDLSEKFEISSNDHISEKAGLILPVTKIKHMLENEHNIPEFDTQVPVFLTAILEYLTVELLEISGNACKSESEKRIYPKHILTALQNDRDLKHFMLDTIIPEAEHVTKSDSPPL